jgi:sulfite exporter TauE/SafE
MVELDVKITSEDLYDFLLRHSYNSVSGLLGAVIGALGVVVGISRQYWIYLILLFISVFTCFIVSLYYVHNTIISFECQHLFILKSMHNTLSDKSEKKAVKILKIFYIDFYFTK